VPRIPGLGPESPLARLIKRVTGGSLTPQGLRVATLTVAIMLALGLVGVVFAVHMSSQPQFCGSCHIMKPYYQSWAQSHHNEIACVECHISPGVTAEIRKKYEAMAMVAKYFTGTYSENPWAEVEDAACLRCHDRRLLEGQVSFHGVNFDHTPHMTETRRGLHLRCTSCHSQIVQGSHIAVTVSTCALCHFKGQPVNAGLAECRACHTVPNRVVGGAKTAFDHGMVARLELECTSCHEGVVRGEGSVPRERCITCHNQPARLAEYGNTLLLHQKHVTEHKVDCMTCHLVIEHGKATPSQTTASAQDAGACASCHGGGHSPQHDLYRGVGGRGVPAMPSPMYTAGVRCEGCHDPKFTAVTAAATPGVHTVKAGEVSCMACHGPGYKGIYQAWRQGVNERTEALRRQLDATLPAMGISAPQAFDDARHNFLLVERGRGVHNVNFAYALLEKSHEQLNQARRARGLAPMSRPWTVITGSSDCLTCHAGIENQSGTFGGRPFAHAKHVVGAKLACTECHRPHAERAPGEVVRFGPQACVPCHHRNASLDASFCGKCHGDVSARTVKSFRGEFSHKAHLEQGLECATCHNVAASDPRPQKSACEQCHAD
jgi:predicted CXXCH cytochrome family protein